MGQSSSQVKQEDIDQPATDRITPPDSTADKDISPNYKIESDVLTQSPTQPTSDQQPDPFRTPKRKRRFSFEIRIPTPAECLKMARPSDAPMSEPARPAKRKRLSNDQVTPSSQRVKIKDRLSLGNGVDDGGSLGDVASTQGFTPSKQTPNRKRKRTITNGTPRSSQARREEDDDEVTFRPGHVSQDNEKKTGFFSPEEIEVLEHFKVEFCNEHHISAETFDASIQSSSRHKSGIFESDDTFLTNHEFWKQIYELIPDRDKRSIYRFMRRHFSTGNTPHQWTTADDDELERLHNKLGTKWAQIAREMERTQDDVVQRWKNKVEHRSTMKEGPWDEDEVEKLLDIIEETRNIHLQMEKEDLGRDIYELDEQYISWGAVSNRFGNTRSRQQCADKWRKIKRNVRHRRALGEEDAVYEPSNPPRPGRRRSSHSPSSQNEDRMVSSDDENANKRRPRKRRSRTPKQVYKSKEIVESSDEDEDEEEHVNENEQQHTKTNASDEEDENENDTEEQPVKVNDTSRTQANKSAVESSDSSSEDDSDSESSSDEEDDNAEDENVNEEVDENNNTKTTNQSEAQQTIEASDDESVIPETQPESRASPSPGPGARPNGHADQDAQPSQELGHDPVVNQSDAEDADEGEEEEESEAASPNIKEENKSDSVSRSDSDSDSDDESDSGSSDEESGSEEEEEEDTEEIDRKIFKFKKEPGDDD